MRREDLVFFEEVALFLKTTMRTIRCGTDPVNWTSRSFRESSMLPSKGLKVVSIRSVEVEGTRILLRCPIALRKCNALSSR